MEKTEKLEEKTLKIGGNWMILKETGRKGKKWEETGRNGKNQK